MVVSYKNKFNKQFEFPLNESHSLKEISKLTGYKKAGLQTIFNKGYMAFYTNHQSVRPTVKTPEQWAYARIYSAVMGGKAAVIDEHHLVKKN